MNSYVKKSLAGLTFCLTSITGAIANTNNSIVFIHGAHFSSDSWQLVQTELTNNEITSYAVNLPGRNDLILPNKISLELSAASLCSFLGTIPNKKMIVAHSQGGAIINASLSFCPEETIEKIVYLTAVAPLNNEGVFTKLNKTDELSYFSGVQYNQQKQLMEISDFEKFSNSFAQDATPKEKNWLLTHSKSEPAPIGEGKMTLSQQPFDSLEKYYIFAKNDQIISLESQKKDSEGFKLKSQLPNRQRSSSNANEKQRANRSFDQDL